MSRSRTANLLGAAALAIVDELDRVLPPEREAAAIVLVRQNPGDSVDALARRLRLTHSGAVRLADRLCAAGALARGAAAGDRRRVALRLTPAGERRADELLAARAERLEWLVGGLAGEERAALDRMLDAWLTALTGGAEEGERICRLCDLASCPLADCPVERAS